MFVSKHKKTYSVILLCKCLKITRSAYYNWILNKNKSLKNDDFKLISTVKNIFKSGKNTYGSRRMKIELNKAGIEIGRFKVRNLMKKLSLVVRFPKSFRFKSAKNCDKSPNILNQNFTANAPNKVWSSDITYIKTTAGWTYLAIIMDLYSRQIIGYSYNNHMRTELITEALQMAYWRRKPANGLILHSDQGSQYCSNDYRKLLDNYKIIQSMNKAGRCTDNAPVERFFRSLKYEFLNYEQLANLEDTKYKILDYLAFYNGSRIHSYLGYKTPINFEQDFYLKVK